MNNKGFLVRHWMVAFIVLTAIIGIGALMVQGLGTRYDNTKIIDQSFDAKYNKLGNISGTISTALNASSSDTGIAAVGGTTANMFKATFTVIGLAFRTLLLPSNMLRSAAIDAQVPELIANILFVIPILIITITIVLVVLSAVSRGKI